jgi:aryl-alcohol dehydrogenase-like predicted oxidoreductase
MLTTNLHNLEIIRLSRSETLGLESDILSVLYNSMKLKKQWRHSIKYFQGFYKKNNVTPAQFTVRFCLDNKNISSIIPGKINEKEVLENVYSSKIHKISRSDNIKIRKIYKSNFCFEIKEIQTNKQK